ncbi:hypothetical protein Aple_091240 [Acrocarpospora pleiomorpha]|uniref:Uncharacterized protein n=1 Tax=Acrocarpospora pleiomorpha TaxID=90975 RepID=A0A5M3XYL6_9ACTN|nr:hypothetical protein [Acrocarpospora pleiomorpha]GES26225.1 hypothetical protein Aple_091240 [Acrocarpospora pleiomorpha]
MTFRTRLAGVLLAGAAVAAVPAAPAAAHPFGPPSTARISVDGSHVAIAWLAAEDDWVALGRSVGAFGDPSAGVDTTLTGEQKLARSTAVRDYLLARVGVTQAGQPCAAELAPLERLLAEGARFSFACANPVVDVDVRIDALTDLHEAYRTVLTAETPATPTQAMLTAATATQRLRFDPSATGGISLVVPAIALVAALGALAAFLVRGRRRAGTRA